MARLRPCPFKTGAPLRWSASCNVVLSKNNVVRGSKYAFLFCFHLAGAAEGLPVLFGLVGVERSKLSEGFSEGRSVSERPCDHQRIARARVTACQQRTADFTESHQPAAGKVGEVDGALVVVQLTNEEVARSDVRPAEERV